MKNTKVYTEADMKKILAKIDKAPHFMEAVKASKVSYSTIRNWKRKLGQPMKRDRVSAKMNSTKPLAKGFHSELFKIANEHLAIGAKLKTLLSKL